MNADKYRELPLAEVVSRLRRAAGVWFKNDDLLLLEELIRRTEILDRTIERTRNELDNRS